MAIALEGSVAPATWAPLRIATDRCKGCELCLVACTPGVLALDTSVVNVLGYHPVRLIDAAACTSCARCAKVCPDAVFTVFAPPRAARAPRHAKEPTR
jgi:2-oxoglutarate ferredoxin oxidoreductase subunit delta